MNSRRPLWSIAIIIWSAVALTAATHTIPNRQSTRHSRSGDEPIASCSDLNITFENHRTIVQSEERTISRAEAPTLRIQAESNGGLQVQGWDKDDYGVTLCKAADSEGNAEDVLSQIHMTFQNGELSVSGPSSHERWAAHLLVKAPKSASLDLRVNNGPLRLFNVDGDVKARAQNGPITLNGCAGNLDLITKNGPVTLENNSGKLHLDAQNGPVTISLKGTTWAGSGIEAHANNGPLALSIPAGYQSGVVVESDGHSPFSCQASVCSEGRKTWDDNRRTIEFGSGPRMIHLSTVNGPISIN
jgi:hypothetical protein